MSSTYQISDKRGDAILVVKVEAPDDVNVGNVYARFVELATEAGIQTAVDYFDGSVPAAAVAAAAPLTQPVVAAAAQAWGNPPVPPMVPAAAANQPVTTPVCQHGPKQYKSGTGAKGPWAFWGCTARSDDPTKCEKEWVR